MRKLLYFFIIVLVLLVFYARYVEHDKLNVNYYHIENNNIPDSFDGFTIVQFSDFLYPNTTSIETLNKVVKTINELDSDIIIFTGNLVEKEHEMTLFEKDELISSLSNLKSNITKLAIIGIHDSYKIEEYIELFEESDFEILDNENKYIYYKDINPILITGYTNSLSSVEKDEEIAEIYNIGLINVPDDILKIKDQNDLYMAGYSLGGYINLGFTKPIILKKDAKYFINGRYKHNDSEVFVSNGLGTDKIKFRFLNKPSINVYKIKTTN